MAGNWDILDWMMRLAAAWPCCAQSTVRSLWDCTKSELVLMRTLHLYDLRSHDLPTLGMPEAVPRSRTPATQCASRNNPDSDESNYFRGSLRLSGLNSHSLNLHPSHTAGLAAAMQYCGFRSFVSDGRSGPDLAKYFYKSVLFKKKGVPYYER
ncbi:hypothetical protein EDB86DRAFT_2214119 [Lactarius hatsudake]|nr:hypothetical protein EDB86DRAFT_2214119 [Lactarius hatsudake]